MPAVYLVIGLLFVFILMVLVFVRLPDWKAKVYMILVLLLIAALLHLLAGRFPGM